MSRFPRIEYEGAWYHVWNHGISCQPVLETSEQRELFFKLFGDVSRMFNCEIHAYILTDNCYHLLIHTLNANISVIMQYINGTYTQRFNRINERKGPLFCGRYKSVLIHADMYLIQVSRYIHWLPVLLGLCQKPSDYSLSSYAAYCRVTATPNWLYCQNILKRFSTGHIVNEYMSYVESGVDREILKFYQRKHLAPVLGPATFCEQMIAVNAQSKSFVKLRPMNKKPSVADIMDYIRLNCDDLNHQFRGIEDCVLKKITMLLCKEVVGYNLKEIAAAFDVDNPRSVSVIVSRIKNKIDFDEGLSIFYRIVRERVALEYC